MLAKLASECFEDFLASSHFQYIRELKAKEGHIPKLDDFKVIRVMGEGGFGQVIDVVKRDCGVHYAMKVMQKEMITLTLTLNLTLTLTLPLTLPLPLPLTLTLSR